MQQPFQLISVLMQIDIDDIQSFKNYSFGSSKNSQLSSSRVPSSQSNINLSVSNSQNSKLELSSN